MMKYSFHHLMEFVDLSTFSQQKFSINHIGRLALVSTDYMIITDGVMNDDSDDVEGEIDDTVIKLFPGAVVTAIIWISDDLVCLGFETGSFSCFNVEGTMVFERQYKQEAVKSMRVSSCNSTSGWLWVLYDKGFLVQNTIGDMLLGQDGSSVIFTLVENTLINDFEVLSTVYVPPSVFGLGPNCQHRMGNGEEEISPSHCHSVLIAGISDAQDIGGGGALSLYNIGAKQHFQHLGKMGSFVKSHVSAVLTRAFQSLSLLTPPPTTGKLTSKTLASLVDFEDPKRQIMRLTLDPSGTLVAAADSLGRVLLYDSSICMHVVVRIWKGVRDAQLAWSSSTSSLSLAILAPQVGLVSFYGMKHGPCQRVLPVPTSCQCQLYTSMSMSNNSNRKVARCYLAMANNDNSGGRGEYDSISIHALDPSAKGHDDLDPNTEIGVSSTSSSFVKKHALAETKDALLVLGQNPNPYPSGHELLSLLDATEAGRNGVDEATVSFSPALHCEVCEHILANAKTSNVGTQESVNALIAEAKNRLQLLDTYVRLLKIHNDPEAMVGITEHLQQTGIEVDVTYASSPSTRCIASTSTVTSSSPPSSDSVGRPAKKTTWRIQRLPFSMFRALLAPSATIEATQGDVIAWALGTSRLMEAIFRKVAADHASASASASAVLPQDASSACLFNALYFLVAPLICSDIFVLPGYLEAVAAVDGPNKSGSALLALTVAFVGMWTEVCSCEAIDVVAPLLLLRDASSSPLLRWLRDVARGLALDSTSSLSVFDENHLLCRQLIEAAPWSRAETHLAISAAIIEILAQSPSSSSSLSDLLEQWQTWFDRIRSLLILKQYSLLNTTRKGAMRQLSIGDLSLHGSCSVYTLLAEDMVDLRGGVSVDSALYLENTCRHANGLTNVKHNDNDAMSKKGALDLTRKSCTTVDVQQQPLLYYFPLHNQPVALASYRALVCAARWSENNAGVDSSTPTATATAAALSQQSVLGSALEHLHGLSVVRRAAVSRAICERWVFPEVRRLLGTSYLPWAGIVVDLLQFVDEVGTLSLEHTTRPLQMHPDIKAWPPVDDAYLTLLDSTLPACQGANAVASIRLHMSVFRVLQLKNWLRIEDARLLSKVFGCNADSWICTEDWLNSILDVVSDSSGDSKGEEMLDAARVNFARTCLERLASMVQPKDFVSLSSVSADVDEGFHPSKAHAALLALLSDDWSISIQNVRELELNVLLNHDNVNIDNGGRDSIGGDNTCVLHDDEIETLIPLIHDTKMACSAVVAACRQRIGVFLLDQGPDDKLVSLVDADIVRWCQQAGVENQRRKNGTSLSRQSLESTRGLLVRIKKSLLIASKSTTDHSDGWWKEVSNEADALLNLLTTLLSSSSL